MSVAETRMSTCICGNMHKDKIRNECIRERVRVVPMEEKKRENRLSQQEVVKDTLELTGIEQCLMSGYGFSEWVPFAFSLVLVLHGPFALLMLLTM
ncbi:hypothetical protein L1049_025860 [Liquidambar formosana]|uniref:Uncharacterized protein n=1 Tax=Liquidambar formosana TaxID=63359 RepID=A0AAP0R6X6_LIQFO